MAYVPLLLWMVCLGLVDALCREARVAMYARMYGMNLFLYRHERKEKILVVFG